MWTIEEAQELIRNLDRFATDTGWHFALAGGVLRNGKSDHDIDIIAYPRTSTDCDRARLYELLNRIWTRRKTVEEMHQHWKDKGGKDRKHVEVWKTLDGRRVDLFILGDNPGWFGEK